MNSGKRSNKNSNKLNRFTTLPVLLDLLIRKRLVFSDPKSWEDKNDSEILEIYREKRRTDKLFTLCFLMDDETIHHWKAFADGISGCCIQFDKAKLTSILSDYKTKGVRFGSVIYKRLNDVGDGAIDECVHMIPFIKRWPYRFEKEFRVIWTGDTWNGDTGKNYEIPIDPKEIITKITLSPSLKESDQLYITIRNYLSSRIECKINPSTVYENREGWIEKFKKFKEMH